MNLIEMKLVFELETKLIACEEKKAKTEGELAEINELLGSLNIYTKAINGTMQQFETKPMFIETLLEKLGIVDMKALEERKATLEKELLQWDATELKGVYACRIAAVTYPYKRLVIEELTDEYSRNDGLSLCLGSRSLEEELVMDSLWREVWSGWNRKFLSGGTWSHPTFARRKPNYQSFQADVSKKLAEKAEWQTKNKTDAFEHYRTIKTAECLGKITEEQYLQLFTDLLSDLRKFSELGSYYFKS
jgi:hypothetical protein